MGFCCIKGGVYRSSYHLTPASNRCLVYATLVRTSFGIQFQNLLEHTVWGPSILLPVRQKYSSRKILTCYAENGWVEVENNIAENALRLVSLVWKNFLFFDSDHGGERGALLCSLLGTCRLNGVDPEHYRRHVLNVIADWPVNRVSELLPWRVALPAE